MLQTHLKVALHCTKPLPFIYFHGKNILDQPSVKFLKPIYFLFLNKRWRCNKMLLFHLSLPFYQFFVMDGSVPHPNISWQNFRTQKLIFLIWLKKCDLVCFGNVSIRYNINDCVHSRSSKCLVINKADQTDSWLLRLTTEQVDYQRSMTESVSLDIIFLIRKGNT